MIEKLGYIIENHYICSVINERLQAFSKLKNCFSWQDKQQQMNYGKPEETKTSRARLFRNQFIID